MEPVQTVTVEPVHLDIVTGFASSRDFVVGVYPRTSENKCVHLGRTLVAQISGIFDQGPDGFATAKTEQIALPPSSPASSLACPYRAPE